MDIEPDIASFFKSADVLKIMLTFFGLKDLINLSILNIDFYCYMHSNPALEELCANMRIRTKLQHFATKNIPDFNNFLLSFAAINGEPALMKRSSFSLLFWNAVIFGNDKNAKILLKEHCADNDLFYHYFYFVFMINRESRGKIPDTVLDFQYSTRESYFLIKAHAILNKENVKDYQLIKLLPSNDKVNLDYSDDEIEMIMKIAFDRSSSDQKLLNQIYQSSLSEKFAKSDKDVFYKILVVAILYKNIHSANFAYKHIPRKEYIKVRELLTIMNNLGDHDLLPTFASSAKKAGDWGILFSNIYSKTDGRIPDSIYIQTVKYLYASLKVNSGTKESNQFAFSIIFNVSPAIFETLYQEFPDMIEAGYRNIHSSCINFNNYATHLKYFLDFKYTMGPRKGQCIIDQIVLYLSNIEKSINHNHIYYSDMCSEIILFLERMQKEGHDISSIRSFSSKRINDYVDMCKANRDCVSILAKMYTSDIYKMFANNFSVEDFDKKQYQNLSTLNLCEMVCKIDSECKNIIPSGFLIHKRLLMVRCLSIIFKHRAIIVPKTERCISFPW